MALTLEEFEARCQPDAEVIEKRLVSPERCQEWDLIVESNQRQHFLLSLVPGEGFWGGAILKGASEEGIALRLMLLIKSKPKTSDDK